MDISRNTSMTSNEEGSRLAYKFVRVEEDVTLAAPSEDEVMEVEHLLAEPKHEKVSVDGLLCSDIENPEKCLAIDDFPISIDHNQIKIDNGTFGSTVTRDWSEESKLEFLDRMLQGVDEEFLHENNGLSGTCDDYLLDTGFDGKNPDEYYGPCEGSGSRMSFESHFTGLNERGTSATEKSELPPMTAALPESKPGQNELDKMTIHELHEAFRSTFGRETLVKDKQWLIRRISSHVQNLVQPEDVMMGFSEFETSTRENTGGLRITSWNDSPRVFCSSTLGLSNRVKPAGRSVVNERRVDVDVSKTISSKACSIALSSSRDKEDAPSTCKRLRKPTRRYIEESSDMRSRHYSRRIENPISNSRSRYLLSRSYNQHQMKGSDLQVPFDPQRRKHLKTNTSIRSQDHDHRDNNDRFLSDSDTNSDLEPSPAESHDDLSDDSALTKRNLNGGSRRKHHRLWNLSEVMKLIDGVSQYGVGRWTDIKRLLFSSSAHRTSVDLKDKWRNLLRASGTQFKKKREVEQGRKSPSLPIPQSVLQRVSELAIIYPYPRDRKSKLTRSSLVGTPVRVADSSDTTISQSGRTTRGKSVT